MDDLATIKSDLQTKLNAQIKQTSHLQRVHVAPRKEVSELKVLSKEILGLLKASRGGALTHGREQSSCAVASARVRSPDARTKAASPKLVSPLSLKSTSSMQPPTARSEVSSAAFELDQAVRNLFNEGKPFTIPPIKSTPREVFEAYYKKKSGETKGLIEARRAGQRSEDKR